MLFKSRQTKIFCIGQNKTGTTTIETVLKSFNYRLGNQVKGEWLLNSWYERDFKKIIKFCKTAEAFQDVPFSLPYTYQHLDVAFPKAKFILTERDSDEQWYQSMVKFHTKLFGNGNHTPTWEDLKLARYRYEGYMADVRRKVHSITEGEEPYDAIKLKHFYNTHNASVKNYFKSRPEKLLIINVANAKDYGKLCAFLNQPKQGDDFPWENRT
ncbi:sulfotransferase [Lacinutrix himadriensis]|uniref:sulfotransferase n=1 Tax=Lacinutrix himadriensis TaxID=641549 RepID=UPI0006E38995|nr:sulfotransferase [Lacinutrix himadriensis]